MMRIFWGVLVMCMMLGGIGSIFWYQEMQYWMPTPIPENVKQVSMGDPVNIGSWIKSDAEKPIFLHFYNFDCPCSRFNIKEFQSMYFRYRDSINFIAVVQSSIPGPDLAKKFQHLMGVAIQTHIDTDGQLAKAMGIYSTPQAVIINNQNKIFYKGNYNAARFCTTRSTKFAEMALEDILAGKESPRFAEAYIDLPYGCLIPAYESSPVSLTTNAPASQ